MLYSDKEGFSEDGDFLQSELNILTQELGSDFFAGTGISTVSDSASSNQSSDFSFNSDGGNISKSSLLANQETGVEFESDSDEYCDNLNDSENESSGLMKYGSDGMDESELKALMSIDDNAFSFD